MCILDVGNSGQNEMDPVQEIRDRAKGAEVGAAIQHHLCYLDCQWATGGSAVVHPNAGRPSFGDLATFFDALAPHAVDFCASHSGSFVVFCAVPIRAWALVEDFGMACHRGDGVSDSLRQHSGTLLPHDRPSDAEPQRLVLAAVPRHDPPGCTL
jgi:hypothetical protein